jgi:hypothetical protein
MSEATEQMALIEFATRFQERIPELAWLFHPANGEKRDKATAARLRMMGVKRGVPDLWLPVARYDAARNVAKNGLVIELKFGKNKQTPEQTAWLGFLARQGWEVHTCYDWTAAARALVAYLGRDAGEFGL